MVIFLLACGLVPALVVAFVFEMQQGRLAVQGSELANPFGSKELLAALTSFFAPLMSLYPLSVFLRKKSPSLVYSMMPTIMYMPPLLASMFVGAKWDGGVLIFLACLVVWQANLALWTRLLHQGLGVRWTVVIWAVSWTMHDFLQYVRDYLVSYFEWSFLSVLPWASWLVPPVNHATELADSMLLQRHWMTMMPIAIQLFLLFGLNTWLSRRQNP